MLPINPKDISDPRILEDLLNDARFTPSYRQEVADRIAQVAAERAVLQARQESLKQAAARRRTVPKARGTVDGRSVKHASINAGVVGGVASAGIMVDQVVDTYIKLDSAGLVPDSRILLSATATVVQELGAWVVVLALFVGGVTLVYKALKSY